MSLVFKNICPAWRNVSQKLALFSNDCLPNDPGLFPVNDVTKTALEKYNKGYKKFSDPTLTATHHQEYHHAYQLLNEMVSVEDLYGIVVCCNH